MTQPTSVSPTRTEGLAEQVESSERIDGLDVEIITYRMLDRYLCRIDLVADDLVAAEVIARGEGGSPEEAVAEARSRAERQITIARSLEIAVRRVAALRADFVRLKDQLAARNESGNA